MNIFFEKKSLRLLLMSEKVNWQITFPKIISKAVQRTSPSRLQKTHKEHDNLRSIYA
jgi:hypothetical protein